MVEEEDIVTS